MPLPPSEWGRGTGALVLCRQKPWEDGADQNGLGDVVRMLGSCWVKLVQSKSGRSWGDHREIHMAGSQFCFPWVTFYCLEHRWLSCSCIQLTLWGNVSFFFANPFQDSFQSTWEWIGLPGWWSSNSSARKYTSSRVRFLTALNGWSCWHHRPSHQQDLWELWEPSLILWLANLCPIMSPAVIALPFSTTNGLLNVCEMMGLYELIGRSLWKNNYNLGKWA